MMSVKTSPIIKKNINELSKQEFNQWYQLLCQTEVSYQRNFFDELVLATHYAYFSFNKSNKLIAACAVSYLPTYIDGKFIVIIKTNLVCIDSNHRGGSFIRKAGWSSMCVAKKQYPGATLYWASVLLSPVAYLLIAKTFKEYYPQPGNVTPDRIHSIMEYISGGNFKSDYHDNLFDGAGKQSIQPFKLCANSNEQTNHLFKYFTSINPDYINGKAFVCIVPLNFKNKFYLAVKGLKKLMNRKTVKGVRNDLSKL